MTRESEELRRFIETMVETGMSRENFRQAMAEVLGVAREDALRRAGAAGLLPDPDVAGVGEVPRG